MPGSDRPTVLVVGAGINGAALARELVLAGCHVVVADDHDIAAGTTAWSTRLIHGGLRYLEHGEVSLVRESLAERARLVRLAPHLVAPLPFYLPVQGRWGGVAAAAARIVGWERLARRWSGPRGRGSIAVGLGLSLYDLLSGRGWPRHRRVRPGTPGLPAVDTVRFPRGQVYVDAQLRFPERFTVELLVDAAAAAAATGRSCRILPHTAVRIGSGATVHLEDRDGHGERMAVDAVVNVTGAWVDAALAGPLRGLEADGRLVGGTKGSHLVIDSAPLHAALAGHGVYAEATDGRPVFVLPFGPRLVLVGTTDIPWQGDPWEARAEPAEIAYLLAAAGRLFPDHAPTADDVVQHYCGVRPLPAGGRGAPAGITRRHILVRHPRAALPAWSIVGGKLTTCRSLAESAAREIVAALGRKVEGDSRDRPLPGAPAAGGTAALIAATRAGLIAAGVAAGDDLEAAAERTVALFGALAPAAVAGGPVPGPALLPATHLPAAVVRYCVRREWARSLADLVERRLMLLFDSPLHRATLDGVAAVLAAERGGGAADEVGPLVADLERRYGKRVIDDRQPDRRG